MQDNIKITPSSISEEFSDKSSILKMVSNEAEYLMEFVKRNDIEAIIEFQQGIKLLVVQEPIKARALLNRRLMYENKQGQNVFKVAVMSGKYEIIEELLKTIDLIKENNNEQAKAILSGCLDDFVNLLELSLEANRKITSTLIKYIEKYEIALPKQAELLKELFDKYEACGDTEAASIVKLYLDKAETKNSKLQELSELIKLHIMEVEKDNTKEVPKVLKKEIESELPDENDNVALRYAAETGDINTVNELLEKGVSPNLLDENGNTALTLAAYYKNMEIVKVLVEKGANLNLQTTYGNTALEWATRYGNIGMVKYLLEKGANPDLQTARGYTALMAAAERGDAEIVKYLLEKEANPNLQSLNGYTALMAAAERGSIEALKVLLENGANTELTYQDGQTALMKAAKKGKIDIIKLLLLKGANIDTKGNNGETALTIAELSGHVEVVKLLKPS